MSLEDEIATKLSLEIRQEIDNEIMFKLLRMEGWHLVKLNPMVGELGDEIDAWTAGNTKGSYWAQGLVWMFKEESDANWFKLRWLGASA